MAQMLGLVGAIMVAAALVAVAGYGCITIVLTVLTAARPGQADPLAEDLDAFLTDLLGPRDPAPGRRRRPDPADPGRPGPGTTPERRRRRIG